MGLGDILKGIHFEHSSILVLIVIKCRALQHNAGHQQQSFPSFFISNKASHHSSSPTKLSHHSSSPTKLFLS